MHLLSDNTYCHHCWLGAKAPGKPARLHHRHRRSRSRGQNSRPIRQIIGNAGSAQRSPPAGSRKRNRFCSSRKICREADIVTFHTPLTHEGKYPTYHLADTDFFNALEKTPLIINTARGEIINTEALKRALKQKKYRRLSLIAGKTSRT